MKKIKSINKKWQKFLISESGFGEQVIQEGPTDKPVYFKAVLPGPKGITKTPDSKKFKPVPGYNNPKPGEVGLWQAKMGADVYYLGSMLAKSKSNVWVYVVAGPYKNGLSDEGLSSLARNFSIAISDRAGQSDVYAELVLRGFIEDRIKTTPANLTPPPKGSTISQTSSTVDVNDSEPEAGPEPDGEEKVKATKTKAPKGKPIRTRSTRRRRGTPRGFTAYHVARQKKLLRTELQGLSMKGLQGLLWVAAKALNIEPGLGTTGDLDLDGDGTMDGIDGQYYTKTYNLIVKLQKKFFGRGGMLTGKLKGRDNIDGLVGLGTLAKISKLFKIPGSGEGTAARLLTDLDIDAASLDKLQGAFEQLKDEIPDTLLGSVPDEILNVISKAAPAVAQGRSPRVAVRVQTTPAKNWNSWGTQSGKPVVPTNTTKENHSKADESGPIALPEFYSDPAKQLAYIPPVSLGGGIIQLYIPMKKVPDASRIQNHAGIAGNRRRGSSDMEYSTMLDPSATNKDVFNFNFPTQFKFNSDKTQLWKFPDHNIIDFIAIVGDGVRDAAAKDAYGSQIQVRLKENIVGNGYRTTSGAGFLPQGKYILVIMRVFYSESAMILNFRTKTSEETPDQVP